LTPSTATCVQVCTNGSCDPGTDLLTCAHQLYATCDGDAPVLLSACAGHADPYHYHEDLVCHYNAMDTSKHSPLIGVALDGVGLYGRHEVEFALIHRTLMLSPLGCTNSIDDWVGSVHTSASCLFYSVLCHLCECLTRLAVLGRPCRHH
jgi:hypothetical protein